MGWMSWAYGQAVQRADAAVARVLAATDAAFGRGKYTVILTADHGGHAARTAPRDSVDVTIPWIAWGQGVVPLDSTAERITGVRTMDTAATVLWLLGVPVPAGWDAPPVTAAFRARSGRAAARRCRCGFRGRPLHGCGAPRAAAIRAARSATAQHAMWGRGATPRIPSRPRRHVDFPVTAAAGAVTGDVLAELDRWAAGYHHPPHHIGIASS
jgi:hypothetical protein